MASDDSLGSKEAPSRMSTAVPSADMNGRAGGERSDQLSRSSEVETPTTTTGMVMSILGAEKYSSSGVLSDSQARSLTSAGWFSSCESMFLSLLKRSSLSEACDLVKPFPDGVDKLPAKLRSIAAELELLLLRETPRQVIQMCPHNDRTLPKFR